MRHAVLRYEYGGQGPLPYCLELELRCYAAAPTEIFGLLYMVYDRVTKMSSMDFGSELVPTVHGPGFS